MACSSPGSNQLSDAQLGVIVCNHFGDIDYQTMLVAFSVAIAESSGFVDAWNQCGEDSRGLWQINVVPAANPQFAGWNLFDPDQNAQAARIIHDAAGGFGPWSTYNSSAYTAYLARAELVLSQGCNFTEGPTTPPCPDGMVPDSQHAGRCICSDPSQFFDTATGMCVPTTPLPPTLPGQVINPATGQPTSIGVTPPVIASPAASGSIAGEISGSVSTGALLLLAIGAGIVVYGVSQQRRY